MVAMKIQGESMHVLLYGKSKWTIECLHPLLYCKESLICTLDIG